MKKIRLLLSGMLVALIIAACGTAPTSVDESSDRDPDPARVVTLNISPRSIMDGKVGQQYTFDMVARNIPADVRYVSFTYTITGSDANFTSKPVIDGEARFSLNHTFTQAGTYAVMAAVAKPTHPTDPAQSEVLAAGRAIVAVETDPVREIDLGSCEGWVPANSGGYGVHIDIWDLTGVPEGAVIDMQWDTIGIPDNFIVEYPFDVLAFETGFVGDPHHDGNPLYPGGVVGGPRGSADGIFEVSADAGNEFVVTTLGPHRNTRWSYEIRCRVPAP